MSVIGTIYLLHFEPRFKHAGHYLGWTEGPVEDRVATHLAGQGSPLVKAALAAGCAVTLVATWEQVDRHEERRMKNSGSSTRLCPHCKPASLASKAASNRRRRARLALSTPEETAA